MNPIIDDTALRRLNRLALPAVILWSLSSVAGAFLSKSTTERVGYPFEPFFEIFHFTDVFGIAEQVEGGVAMKTVTTTTLVPDPHRIVAIYRAASGSFVTISDAKETTIVALGGRYKKSFRLIGLTDTSAIFSGHGTSYRLRLGRDDNLSREEVITRSVPDPKHPAAGGAEWLSIPYQTIADQMKNTADIGKSIALSEVKSASGISGFRIDAIASESLFAKLGLMQGDVIESVNNQKLNSYADALAVYSKVPHLRSIRISVLRNNLKKDIVYEITR